MKIDIITLFPDLVTNMAGESILKRAQEKGLVEIVVHNLREYATDKYKSVDDRPYGGGPGMVLRFDILHQALLDIKSNLKSQMTNSQIKTILLTPQGQPYRQTMAKSLAKETNLILICGHYEGYDERIREYVDQEISIGDYVLTGGELPAMVIVDSVVRLLPGVLGDDTSSHEESFSEGLLEYPQYTRPEEYEGKKVPPVLMGGNHKAIADWRLEQAQEKTRTRRPDLLSDRKI